MGNEASVSGMDMHIKGADGLQISATGNEGTFKSNLTLADLGESVASKDEILPVSTTGDVTNGKLTFYLGSLEDETLYAQKDEANYICFDVYVKVAAGKTLYLDEGSVVEMAEGDDKETHLATRVAFVYVGHATTASHAMNKTVNSSTDPENPNGSWKSVNEVMIWEPNALIRSVAAKNAGVTNDGQKVDYQGINDLSPSGERSIATFKDEDEEGAYVETFAPAQNAAGETTAAQKLFDLEEGYNVIRVYIWLEGQDVDCLNEISNGTFEVVLNFKQEATTPTSGEGDNN